MDTGFMAEMWILLALTTLFVAFLIHHASMRRNWARCGLLVITVLAVTLYIAFFMERESSAWEWTAFTLSAALEGVALYWLFTGEGARWYAITSAEAA